MEVDNVLVPGVGSCLTFTVKPPLWSTWQRREYALDAYRPESCLILCRRAIWSLPSSVLTPSRESYGTSGIYSALSHFPPLQQTQAIGLSPGSCSSEVAMTQAHSP